jgi:hypothetical protein
VGLYIASGDALLAKCTQYASFQFDWELEPPRLQVSQIILDGLWQIA